MSKKKQKNFVLVTVSGGVANTYAFGDVATSEIDFDNWDNDDMTIEQLVELARIAGRIPKGDVRISGRDAVKEIANRGLVYDDLNGKVGAFKPDAEVGAAARALRFFGFDEAADDLEGRHGEIKDKIARSKRRKK